MANPLPFIGLAGDDVFRSAVLTASSENPINPIENAQTDDPAWVFKTLANSVTITATTASVTPIYVVIINSDAETGTFNGNAITFPGVDTEGQRIHAGLSLAGLVAAGTSWSIVLGKASGTIFVGKILILVALHDFNVKHQTFEVGRLRPADIQIPTRGGSIIQVPYGIRTRWARGTVDLIEDEALMSELDLSAKGQTFPFLFVPDENTNDHWLVSQTLPYSKSYSDYDVRTTPFRFEELSGGPPNG